MNRNRHLVNLLALGVQGLKSQMRPGKLYRRVNLQPFSKSLDRDLRSLVATGEVRKARNGLYYRPQQSRFGNLPAKRDDLLKSLLKSDDFLVVSPNAYNALGLGTTQLYNEDYVYNRKRDGRMQLEGNNFYFFKSRRFPRKLTKSFLLVDLVNNLDFLAEDADAVKDCLAKKLSGAELEAVKKSANKYGKVGTQKFFAGLQGQQDVAHG